MKSGFFSVVTKKVHHYELSKHIYYYKSNFLYIAKLPLNNFPVSLPFNLFSKNFLYMKLNWNRVSKED